MDSGGYAVPFTPRKPLSPCMPSRPSMPCSPVSPLSPFLPLNPSYPGEQIMKLLICHLFGKLSYLHHQLLQLHHLIRRCHQIQGNQHHLSSLEDLCTKYQLLLQHLVTLLLPFPLEGQLNHQGLEVLEHLGIHYHQNNPWDHQR